ncbi:hypothetical protein A2U01_0085294, partial [Trifolium medium]|nr:hypothetical protein [Trifolium medium]
MPPLVTLYLSHQCTHRKVEAGPAVKGTTVTEPEKKS